MIFHHPDSVYANSRSEFPVFQGERVNCEDNTSLGEFTLAPIPPMKAGEAVLEVIFEVDVNGILKVTATEKTSGRSANITISNTVGKLSSGEIESMINDAAKFKTSDDAFTKKFEAKQQLESYISRVEEIVSDPGMSMKLKRGQKEKIEGALSDAMAQLEVDDSANSAEEMKKKELALKRVSYISALSTTDRFLTISLYSSSPRPCLPGRAPKQQICVSDNDNMATNTQPPENSTTLYVSKVLHNMEIWVEADVGWGRGDRGFVPSSLVVNRYFEKVNQGPKASVDQP